MAEADDDDERETHKAAWKELHDGPEKRVDMVDQLAGELTN